MADVPKVLDLMNICILIPVHNESSEIGQIVSQIRKMNLDVIVVDDGSEDSSGSIAQKEGAVVLSHAKKMGKGVSLQDGFHYIQEHDYDGVITMDGDGQHAVTDIDRLIHKAKENSGDIINGTRMHKPQGMPLIRLITNKLMSLIISAACKQKITDTQCGFRYIPSKVLRKIRLNSSGFEIETEVLTRASRKGFSIRSVDIQTIYQNERSKIDPLKDTVRFFVFMCKEVWFRKY